MKALRVQHMEAICPDHLRRHLMIVGTLEGKRVAQCPGEGREWDISSINQQARRVVLDLETGRPIRRELQVEP